jgi:hypothetical protein
MTMSPAHKFVVYAPDKTDEATFARRLSVRPTHMLGANELIAKGVIKYAGAMLTPSSVESQTAEQKMIGSMIVYEAQNIDVVKKMVENDIYYTSGVWDPEQLVILPFKTIPIA